MTEETNLDALINSFLEAAGRHPDTLENQLYRELIPEYYDLKIKIQRHETEFDRLLAAYRMMSAERQVQFAEVVRGALSRCASAPQNYGALKTCVELSLEICPDALTPDRCTQLLLLYTNENKPSLVGDLLLTYWEKRLPTQCAAELWQGMLRIVEPDRIKTLVGYLTEVADPQNSLGKEFYVSLGKILQERLKLSPELAQGSESRSQVFAAKQMLADRANATKARQR